MRDIRTIIDSNILAFSILVLLYFVFLLLNSEYFKIENVAMSIIQELVTIPIIIGQLVLLGFAWKKFKQSNYLIRTWTFVAMIILVASNCFVFISFLNR